MIKQIYIDFDGTLINCQKRIYQLFIDLLEDISDCTILQETYWEYRSQGYQQKELLNKMGLTEAESELFRRKWLDLIETMEYLEFDKPYSGAEELLRYLAPKYELYLISNRQIPSHLYAQLEKYGWFDYFDRIFVTGQRQRKKAVLDKNCEIKEKAVLISDTVEDMQAAGELGIKRIAVRSNLEPWSEVSGCSPWVCVTELEEIKGWL